MVELLAVEAGKNPLEDRYTVGYISALNDILNIDIEEVQVD